MTHLLNLLQISGKGVETGDLIFKSKFFFTFKRLSLAFMITTVKKRDISEVIKVWRFLS